MPVNVRLSSASVRPMSGPVLTMNNTRSTRDSIYTRTPCLRFRRQRFAARPSATILSGHPLQDVRETVYPEETAMRQIRRLHVRGGRTKLRLHRIKVSRELLPVEKHGPQRSEAQVEKRFGAARRPAVCERRGDRPESAATDRRGVSERCKRDGAAEVRGWNFDGSRRGRGET